MALTIYKKSDYVNWNASGTAVYGGGGTGGGITDLSNYYTIQQLQTPGFSVVDFANIVNAYHNNMLGLQGGIEYSDTAPPDSDDSSGVPDIIHEYYHLDLLNYTRVIGQNFIGSLIENSDFTVELDGDIVDPGNNMYYGTDLTGVKGWYPLPEGYLDSSGNPIGGDSFWELASDPDFGNIVQLTDAYNDYIVNIRGLLIYGNIPEGSVQLTPRYVDDSNASGSSMELYASSSMYGEGGSMTVGAGGSDTIEGGGATVQGGSGFTYGGGVALQGGSGGDGGGDIDLYPGWSQTGLGGHTWIYGGWTESGTPGNVYILPGASDVGIPYAPWGNIYFGDNEVEGYGGILHEKTTEISVVFYNPTTGLLTYGEGVGGVTPTNNILEWDAGNSYYRPYTSNQGGLEYTYKDIYGGLYNWYAIGYEIYFDDWYLPSQWEMEQLVEGLSSSMPSGTYWTSTEYDSNNAVTVDDTGTVSYDVKSAIHKIWPIRRFSDGGTSIYGYLAEGDVGPSGGLIFHIEANGVMTYWEARYAELPAGGGAWSNITDESVELIPNGNYGYDNCLYIIGQTGHTESAASLAMEAISRCEVGIVSSSLAPTGWHIPNMLEITELLRYVSDDWDYGTVTTARALVQPGDYWEDDTEATNTSGFSAIGSGRRSGVDGSFIENASSFWMWSADYPEGWGLQIINAGGDFDYYFGKLELSDANDGYSIRMLQDNLKDIDGNEYHTVVINGLEWTVENLKTSRYSSGEQIAIITDDTEWSNDTSGARADYNNDSNVPSLGYLYNGYAVDNGLIFFSRGGAQETGWRLPTLAEWTSLCEAVDNSDGEVWDLMANNYWYDYTEQTNSTLFTAYGSGRRNADGTFQDRLINLYIYTSTIDDGYNDVGMIMYEGSWQWDYWSDKNYGFSVRAVRPVSTVTMTDNDGNSYDTVKIGTQRWITTNLKTESYRDDTGVPYITDNADWMADTEGAMSYWDNAQESGGTSLIFYTGTTDPEGTDRLNLNATLWVTDLYVGGVHIGSGTGDSWWMYSELQDAIMLNDPFPSTILYIDRDTELTTVVKMGDVGGMHIHVEDGQMYFNNDTVGCAAFLPYITDQQYATAWIFDTYNELTAADTSIAVFKNQSSIKAYIDKDGNVHAKNFILIP